MNGNNVELVYRLSSDTGKDAQLLNEIITSLPGNQATS